MAAKKRGDVLARGQDIDEDTSAVASLQGLVRMPEPSDLLLTLVREALGELERPDGRVSVALRKTVRVARMLSDREAVYWIQNELDSFSDKAARRRLILEMAPHFTRDELKALDAKVLNDGLSARGMSTIDRHGRLVQDNDLVTSLSVDEMEQGIDGALSMASEEPPKNLTPGDTLLWAERQAEVKTRAQFHASEMKKVLSRIGNRAHAFLSRVEEQLVQGNRRSAVFERQRTYVDAGLQAVCPKAGEALRSAYERATEGTAESRSLALTSCRRALKAFADCVYPPRSTPVVGSDGVPRDVTDDKYKNRLWQFIHESSANSAARDLLQSEVIDLGSKIDRLNDLASKGVHADVSEFEVEVALGSLYALLRALLLLQSKQSAAIGQVDQLLGNSSGPSKN